MKRNLPGIRRFWQKFDQFPYEIFMSIILLAVLTIVVSYLVGRVFPQYKVTDKLFAWAHIKPKAEYNFYTGPKGGAYYAIGEAVNRGFRKEGDCVINMQTTGGSENAMKLTTEKNAFGFIQEEMIAHDDQLKKNVRIVSPIFLERLHIFYKKDLFPKNVNGVQLSANTDPQFLKCFSKKIKKVNVGQVGSGARVMAGYVLAMIDKQILNNRISPANYLQTDLGFIDESNAMCKANHPYASDIVFYVGADPTDKIRMVLDSGQYQMMAISPSFVVTLNKEFDLGLRITDFKGKYPQIENVSTIGTYAFLITSKLTFDADVLRLVKKIEDSKDSVHETLIHLDASDSSYYGLKGEGPGVLPLKELDFFNAFKDEYETMNRIQGKEVAALILSIVMFIFPVFKSVYAYSSKLRSWCLNKQLDGAVHILSKADKNNHSNILGVLYFKLLELRKRLVDLYGRGKISESHFKPLSERLKMYMDKFPAHLSISDNGTSEIKSAIPASS